MKNHRPIIEKKKKDLIISCLKSVIGNFNLKNIGFISVVGSVEKEHSHDIDFLFFPSEKAKIGETIISLAEIFEEWEKEIRRKTNSICLAFFSKMVVQQMVYYISISQKPQIYGIPIHAVFFTDYKSFIRFNPVGFLSSIKKDMITIYGSFDVIKKIRNDIPWKKSEPYFYIYDFVVNTRKFPPDLVKMSAEALFSYLEENYKIKAKSGSLNSSKNIQKELFVILKKLDRMVYD